LYFEDYPDSNLKNKSIYCAGRVASYETCAASHKPTLQKHQRHSLFVVKGIDKYTQLIKDGRLKKPHCAMSKFHDPVSLLLKKFKKFQHL
jgi:hypothetical protein